MNTISLFLTILASQFTDVRMDILFYDWNKASRKSMCAKLESTKNYHERLRLADEVSVFEMQHGITEDKFNHQSYRYKILEAIHKDLPALPGRYIIIEANSSGEMYVFHTYLLNFISEDSAKVYKYKYDYKDYIFVRDEKYPSPVIAIDSGFNNTTAPYFKGVNRDEVYVSWFNRRTVISSEYFLYTTLSKDDFVMKLLSRYR